MMTRLSFDLRMQYLLQYIYIKLQKTFMTDKLIVAKLCGMLSGDYIDKFLSIQVIDICPVSYICMSTPHLNRLIL